MNMSERITIYPNQHHVYVDLNVTDMKGLHTRIDDQVERLQREVELLCEKRDQLSNSMTLSSIVTK